jgi:hypothetical protein
MGISMTIGTVGYSPLFNADGKYLMSCNTSNGRYLLQRFHPPGTDGNCVGRLGRVGGTITVRLRYIGDLSTILSDIKSDREAFENTAVEIVDINGDTFEYCNLIEWNVIDPKGTANNTGGKAYMDVDAAFARD